MDVSAVQFCARKIAAVSGDMRKALDILRRAVEVVETDVKRQQVLKPIDISKLLHLLFFAKHLSLGIYAHSCC